MQRTLLTIATGFLLSSVLPAAIFTVTNTADSGAGSLRQAILDANANAGADTIMFSVSGAGCTGSPAVCEILPAFPGLPAVTDAVAIDGTTQPGFAGTPLIVLHWTVAASANGIWLMSGGGSTVKGLSIIGFSSGIAMTNAGNNTIQGNWLGLDASGAAAGNGNGVHIGASADNLVGGTTAALRNIICANTSGIRLDGGASNNTIQGNYIGIDPSGTAGMGNGAGIFMFSGASNQIGGAAPGAGNVIAANGQYGIWLGGPDNVVEGNLIGTNAAGTAPLGNGASGIAVVDGSGNQIGSSAPGAGNVIAAGSSAGIQLQPPADSITIHGNFIGTDVTGTVPLGNAAAGIQVSSHAAPAGILIGGSAPGEGNVIAFNGTLGTVPGIWNFDSLGVTIRGNSIHDNTGLGIDLGNSQGVTANDPGDADTGANGLQNFPIVSSAVPMASSPGLLPASTRVQGVLHSMPSTMYTLDFYENPACTPRPQDYLQALIYLGTADTMTDGGGTASFDVTLPATISPGGQVTATATDPAGNTSEVSQRIVFSMSPTAGPPAGGTNVTLYGTDFAAGATVTIGGVAATNVSVLTSKILTATTAAMPAGTVNDVTVANTDGGAGTLFKGFVADFLDVPSGQQFYLFVTTLVSNGITAGIGGGLYGVNDNTLRQQMAVFLLKGKNGLCYVPPPCTGLFPDVVCPSTFAPWIEALFLQGITGGCGGGLYCPQSPVRRDQMAVFLLKTKFGSGHIPPACTGVFLDVACTSPFAPWIEELAALNITGGCGGGNYCPLNNNTRGQMAVFIVKTFNLQ